MSQDTRGTITMNQTLEEHGATLQTFGWAAGLPRLHSVDVSGLAVVWELQNGVWRRVNASTRSSEAVTSHYDPAMATLIVCHRDGVMRYIGDDGAVTRSARLPGKLVVARMRPRGRGFYLVRDEGTSTAPLTTLTQVSDEFASEGTLAIKDITGNAHDTVVDMVVANNAADGARSLALVTPTAVVLLSGVRDTSPVVIPADNCTFRTAAWVHGTDLIAVSAFDNAPAAAGRALVKFYRADGSHLQTLRINTGGNEAAAALTCDATGRRLVAAAGSAVYFISVVSTYPWAPLGTTGAVYVLQGSHGTDSLCFWAGGSARPIARPVTNLVAVAGVGDDEAYTLTTGDNESSIITKHDSGGSRLMSIQLPFKATFLAAGRHVVAAASANHIAVARTSGASGTNGAPPPVLHWLAGATPGALTPPDPTPSDDPVISIALAEPVLCVLRESGAVMRFEMDISTLHADTGLPSVVAVGTSPLAPGTRRIDLSGAPCQYIGGLRNDAELTIYELGRDSIYRPVPGAQRTDVWDFALSRDAPGLYAAVERTRLCAHRVDGGEDMAPIELLSHIGAVSDLCVMSVDLAELYAAGTARAPAPATVSLHPTRQLTDARALAARVDAGAEPWTSLWSLGERTPHPAVLHIVASSALKQDDFDGAKRAYAAAKDYSALAGLREVASIADPTRRRAEVLARGGDVGGAISMLRGGGDAAAAASLAARAGAWDTLEEILESNPTMVGAGRLRLRLASARGRGAAAAGDYTAAADYYRTSGDTAGLLNCLIRDTNLEATQADISRMDSSSLVRLGLLRAGAGDATGAVRALEAAGRRDLAVSVALQNDDFEQALTLGGSEQVVGAALQARLREVAEHGGALTAACDILGVVGTTAIGTTALAAIIGHVTEMYFNSHAPRALRPPATPVLLPDLVLSDLTAAAATVVRRAAVAAGLGLASDGLARANGELRGLYWAETAQRRLHAGEHLRAAAAAQRCTDLVLRGTSSVPRTTCGAMLALSGAGAGDRELVAAGMALMFVETPAEGAELTADTPLHEPVFGSTVFGRGPAETLAATLLPRMATVPMPVVTCECGESTSAISATCGGCGGEGFVDFESGLRIAQPPVMTCSVCGATYAETKTKCLVCLTNH